MAFKRIVCLTLLGLSCAWATVAATPSATLKTRAEVLAEKVLWDRVGLTGLVAGDSIAWDEFERRKALYRQLREGPEFQVELHRMEWMLGAATRAQP